LCKTISTKHTIKTKIIIRSNLKINWIIASKANAWNYGSILQQYKDTSQYKATLIDHEVKNSFKYEHDKHPVISLIEKLKTNASKKNLTGELKCYRSLCSKINGSND